MNNSLEIDRLAGGFYCSILGDAVFFSSPSTSIHLGFYESDLGKRFMGVTRFRIYPVEFLDRWSEVYRAYLRGFDGRVFATQVEIESDIVSFVKYSSESAKLNVAWPVEGLGKPVLQTTSLPEGEEPYILPIELARGKISSMRDQLSLWELQGVRISKEVTLLNHESFELFSRCISNRDNLEEACRYANLAIRKSCEAAEVLTNSYVEFSLALRKKRSNQIPASLGCHLGESLPSGKLEETFCDSFDVAIIPIDWKLIEPEQGRCEWELCDRQVEWCKENRLLMHGGPLLDLSPQGVPEWLWKWDDDYQNLQSFVCDFVETAITRYYGKIRHWEVSARVNTGGALTLSEEDRLSLVARTLEVARQVDEDLQLTIRIDQPWGEYQARGQHRLSPIQFVDALARSGLGLTGISLEIGVGYQPRGSDFHDIMEYSRLIDLWSLLNLPLTVILAFPSNANNDSYACPDLEVLKTDQWKSPWNQESQSDWVLQLLPVFLAKESVVRIEWTHFSDENPHYYPHSGLIDADGRAKTVLETFRWFHREFWKDVEGLS